MTINIIRENGNLALILEGKLDAATAPQLQEVLISALEEAKNVELNFADLAYVSSAGLRVLLLGYKTAKEKGISMVLTGVSEDVMEVLEMTGFADILVIK